MLFIALWRIEKAHCGIAGQRTEKEALVCAFFSTMQEKPKRQMRCKFRLIIIMSIALGCVCVCVAKRIQRCQHQLSTNNELKC